MNRGYTAKEGLEMGESIMAGLISGFEKAMNPPEDGFDGQADIKVLPDESRWAVCPYCGKKAVKILPETKIHMMPYKCKNNKCQSDFIVNV